SDHHTVVSDDDNDDEDDYDDDKDGNDNHYDKQTNNNNYGASAYAGTRVLPAKRHMHRDADGVSLQRHWSRVRWQLRQSNTGHMLGDVLLSLPHARTVRAVGESGKLLPQRWR